MSTRKIKRHYEYGSVYISRWPATAGAVAEPNNDGDTPAQGTESNIGHMEMVQSLGSLGGDSQKTGRVSQSNFGPCGT